MPAAKNRWIVLRVFAYASLRLLPLDHRVYCCEFDVKREIGSRCEVGAAEVGAAGRWRGVAFVSLTHRIVIWFELVEFVRRSCELMTYAVMTVM